LGAAPVTLGSAGSFAAGAAIVGRGTLGCAGLAVRAEAFTGAATPPELLVFALTPAADGTLAGAGDFGCTAVAAGRSFPHENSGAMACQMKPNATKITIEAAI